MLEATDVGPGHLVRRIAEVVLAERLEPGKHRVDLGLFLHKATSASWLDLVFVLWILAIISGFVRLCRT
jgi:hypothetical protein